jgi:hypothetical protein
MLHIKFKPLGTLLFIFCIFGADWFLYHDYLNGDMSVVQLVVNIITSIFSLALCVSAFLIKIQIDDMGIRNISYLINRKKYSFVDWRNVTRVYAPINEKLIPVIIVEGISSENVKSMFMFTYYNTHFREALKYIIAKTPSKKIDESVIKMARVRK